MALRLPLSFIFLDFTLNENVSILVKNENRTEWQLPNKIGRHFMYIPQISNFPQVAFAMRVINPGNRFNPNRDFYVYVGINGIDPVPGSNNSSVAFSVVLFTVTRPPGESRVDVLADGASLREVVNSYPAAFT